LAIKLSVKDNKLGQCRHRENKRIGQYKVTNSVWNKEELPEQWKKSIIVPTYKKGDGSD
jgi:hypothetical protein